MHWRPTPVQERWMAVAARVGGGRRTPWLAERTGGWVAAKPILRCALFVLGAVAAGLTAAVFYFTHFPGYLLLASFSLIGVAEWLVLRRHLFGAGIEEALELAGLLLLVFQVEDLGLEDFGTRMALLIGSMLGVAGFRFLNPLFIVLAAAALCFAIDLAGAHSMASAFCFASAVAALSAGGIQFRRPAYDHMLDWLVVILPLVGYVWFENRTAGVPLPAHAPVFALAPYGAAALYIGIRRRRHAPLLAFMACLGCIGYELRNLTRLPLEAKLILWGSVILLLTLALSRYLRTPRAGISSQKGEDSEFLDLLQLAGAGGLSPQAQPRPAEFKGAGGAGGGGGASGSY
jgi:hypothetical protein